MLPLRCSRPSISVSKSSSFWPSTIARRRSSGWVALISMRFMCTPLPSPLRRPALVTSPAEISAATHRCTRNAENRRRNRPGLPSIDCDRTGSVGACVGSGHGESRPPCCACSPDGRGRGNGWEGGPQGGSGRHSRDHWTRAEGGDLRSGVFCLKPCVSGPGGPLGFFYVCSAPTGWGRLVTWGRGPPHAGCVASPCGRCSYAGRHASLAKCPSKLRKIKHLHPKRGATDYRGQT